MIKERFLGQGENVVLKVFQVFDARHFFHCIRVEEDEIAEPKMTAYQTTEVHPYLLGILVDEMRPAFLGPAAFVGLRRLHNQRHELVFGTDGRQQLVPGHLVRLPVTGKTAVADDPQRVLLMAGVQVPGLFIRTGQHDFRPPPHPQGLELGIQCFCGELQTLLEYEPIEVGQDGGIETDGVFYQQYHLHPGCHVVLQVHFVFYQFDDRE